MNNIPDQFSNPDPLDDKVREKITEKIRSLYSETLNQEERQKRLRTYIKKRINECEAAQIALAEGMLKADEYQTKKEIQEILGRLYIAHQDVNLSEEEIVNIDQKFHMLSQQFPKHFGLSKDYNQN